MSGIWRKACRLMSSWWSATKRRHLRDRRYRIESLEDRQLLTSVFDGEWAWTPTSPINPAPEEPAPFSLTINIEGVSILSAPDFGGIPINLKVTGAKNRSGIDTELKGHGKSDHDRCSMSCGEALNNGPLRTDLPVIPNHLVGVMHFKGPDIPKSLKTIHVDILRVSV